MWYHATINAYDCLGQVVVSATIREAPESASDVPRALLSWVVAIEGVGEPDPQQWLRDALVGLLERV